MQKKFLTNLILLLVLNLLIKPFYLFGIDLRVQNSVDGYGMYNSLLGLSFLFNILLDFGITSFNNRNIAQNEKLLNKYFSSIVIMKFLLAVVYAVASFAFVLLFPPEGYDINKILSMLGWLCFNQFLLSFLLYLRSNISGLLMFKTDSLLSVLDRVLMIIIIGALLNGWITDRAFKIEWFIYGQTAGYLLTVLIALAVVIKKSAFKKINWNFPFFILITKQSIPYAILALLMSFYNRFDAYLLLKILPEPEGEIQSSIYAYGFRILDAFNNFAYLFSVILLPLFARMIKTKDNIQPTLRMAFSFLLVGSLTIALISYEYPDQIMELLKARHANEAAKVFSIIIFSFIPISMIYIFGTLLTANGNLWLLNLIAIGSLALSLILNIILIPELKAFGSAIASIAAQSLSAIFQIILSFKIFKFKIDVKFLLSVISYVFLLIIGIQMSHSISDNWLINVGAFGLLSFLAASLLRLLDFKNFKEILKSKN